jgi:hypothetical protein
MGGYSHINFSSVGSSFDIVRKTWLFGGKETTEYRLLADDNGSPQWFWRLKYVNDKPYESPFPTDSPWHRAQIENFGVRILEKWGGGE